MSNPSVQPPPLEQQLTAREAAVILRTTPWGVTLLCRSGELRASKPGKAWLIDPRDVQAYLDAHRNQDDVVPA